MIRWLLKFWIPKAKVTSQSEAWVKAILAFRQMHSSAIQEGETSFFIYPHWFHLTEEHEELFISLVRERGYTVIQEVVGYRVYFPGGYDES